MKIIHAFGRAAAKSVPDSDGLSFFLSNQAGGFAHFVTSNSSKFQGFFAEISGSLFKVVESLSPPQERIEAVENKADSAAFRHSTFTESYSMPKSKNSLVYQLSRELPVELFLDIRKADDFRQWGRNYDSYFRDGTFIVEFTKKTDSREDGSSGKKEFTVAVAIRHDGTITGKNDWVKRDYGLDRKRNSASERYVYHAATITASNIVISVSGSAEKAAREAGLVFGAMARLKEEAKAAYPRLTAKNEVALASAMASIALKKLETKTGMYAGLPWFFQEWARDELVSCAALGVQYKRRIVLKHLNRILEDGRLPNVETGTYAGSPSSSADSIGWLFKRASELVEERALPNAEVKKVEVALKKSIDCLLKNHCRNGFVTNTRNETWMDTDYNDDGRQGVCIEIQALQLNMYRLMHKLTGEKTYQLLENSLRQNVRKFFWNGSVLADRLNDFTIRPNPFIAAYIYPELLSKKEWETCITTALSRLWLDWGGLATIDKSHRNFHDNYTGETNESYHRGDSWFWINNIAAMVMHNVNRKRFSSYIRKITEASANDILWKGAVGCASELSSAQEQKAEGCLNQAWSNSTFIELVKLLPK